MHEVILIDAGTGNLRSVQKALEKVGASVTRTDDPQVVRGVPSGTRIVLPGVGAFGDFMSGLRAKNLDTAIKEVAACGIPFLGICVGMQALFDSGEELGEHTGLGLLSGRVLRFPGNPAVKIPHTGWNQLEIKENSKLFSKLNDNPYVYFNHSYYCQVEDSSDVTAEVEYGMRYACSVKHANIYGVQFHPEKSQLVGLEILRNFLEVV